MLIGNPQHFALMVERVDAWSEHHFHNGILNLYIKGELFPNRLTNAVLNSELYTWFEKKMSALIQPKVNEQLFYTDKYQAILALLEITFPEDVNKNNDYSYDCHFLDMSDYGDYVFLISNHHQARILAVNLHNITEETILEAFISLDELNIITNQLRQFYENLTR